MLAKLKMLKEVLRQMQCAMAEGHGDSEGAGEEAMESLAEGGDEKKIGEPEDADKEEYGDEKKDFMKRGRKLPMGGKGTKIAMMKMMVSKKPEVKKPKYG